MAAVTDPEELLEVFDSRGRPTGRAKARGPVHRDGDWHLAFFCWIVRSGGRGPELVLQKRSAVKDVWPERFDASAAGHVRFGETRQQMLREVAEELGLLVSESELVQLPGHRQEHRHSNGLIDREHHDLNLLRCELPFEAYRPSLVEVSGLTAVLCTELADLAEDMRAAIESEFVEFFPTGSTRCSPLRLEREHLVPYDRGYYRGLAEHATRLVSTGAAG